MEGAFSWYYQHYIYIIHWQEQIRLDVQQVDLFTYGFQIRVNKIPPTTQGATAPRRPEPPHYRGFTNTLRHITVGRTPLDE